MGSNAEKCAKAKELGADITINREETLAHPLEERLNERVLVRVARFRAHSSIHRDARLRADYLELILHRIIRLVE